VCEPLEQRRLLTVSGIVFNDTNGNGIQDAGEAGVANCVVYADSNGDFSLDDGESSTTTSTNGAFSFSPSIGGDLRTVLPANMHNTGTLTAVQPSVNAVVNIGQAPGLVVSGVVFVDQNGSGSIGNGYSGISGRTVYEDLNNNGIFDAGEPSTTTYNGGRYSFTIPQLGTLRSVAPAGWVSTSSGVPVLTYTGLTVYLGEFQDMTVTGICYADNNSNGERDATEPGLAGVTAYIDVNNNGVDDSGDLSAVSDSSGYFSITGIVPPVGRTYSILQFVTPSGYLSETTSVSFGTGSGAVYQNRYGESDQSYVRGTVSQVINGSYSAFYGQTIYADLNNDGIFDAGDIAAGFTDPDGLYQFGGLPQGQVTIRIAMPNGYNVASGTSASQTINVTSLNASYVSFSLVAGAQASTSGALETSVYEDSNGNSAYDIAALPDPGRTVYLDTNDNGFLDPGEPTQVTNSAGLAIFTGLPPASYLVRQWLPGGETQTAPSQSSGYTANLSASQTQYVGPFNTESTQTGSISGSIFLDTNGDGLQDAGESNASSASVYIDSNQDGVYDISDISATETASGFTFNNLTPGTYIVRQILNPGYQQTAPAAGAGLTATVTAGQTTPISFGTDNPVPTAVISGPTSVPEGAGILLTAAASSEIGGVISKYEWDSNYTGTFVPDTTGASVTFSAAALDGPLTRVVALRVTDAAGNTNITTCTIQILNVAPTAVFTGSSVVLGQAGSVMFSNVTDPSAADTAAGFTYSYDFSDSGTFEILGSTNPLAAVPASYLSTAGAHTIHGRVQDKDGGFTDYLATVEVTAAVAKQLSGAIIGTSGSYGNSGNTIAKAFDGNFSTYFDAPTASGSWVGLDLGSPVIITQVSYASRSGWASRMNGGTFQGSSSANFSSSLANLFVIGANANVSSTSLTNSPVNVSTPYRYVRYIGPANSYCNVSELEFFGISPPPVSVTSVIFNPNASAQSLSFTLSGPLSADPGIAAVSLLNETNSTATTVPPSDLAESYNASAGTMTITFPGFTGASLPAGIYQATLVAADVTDSNGLHPGSNSSYSFLTVPSSGKLTLSTGRATISVQQISIQTGGLLDLANNDLILQGGEASGLNTLLPPIQSGYHNGSWQGSSGIVSSSAAGDTRHLTALGLVLSTGQPFESLSTLAGDVLLKYTYYGDTNLDGKVDGSDYSMIDNGYTSHLTGWANGDFNYDGVVDGSDYALIDNSFNRQGAILAAVPAEAVAVKPGKVVALQPGKVVASQTGQADRDSAFSSVPVAIPQSWTMAAGSTAANSSADAFELRKKPRFAALFPADEGSGFTIEQGV